MRIVLQTFIALGLWSTFASFSLAQEHHSDHHKAESHSYKTPNLNQGKLWATDSSLREGMRRIQKATLTAQSSAAGGVLDKSQAALLTSSVDSALTFMFEHCKLEPEADTNLHILLERLMQASEALKKEPHTPEGLPQILGVLSVYPKYFEHTGWKSVTSTN